MIPNSVDRLFWYLIAEAEKNIIKIRVKKNEIQKSKDRAAAS